MRIKKIIIITIIIIIGSGELSRYSGSLRAGRSGDRIPVWARFSATVHTGHGAHSASYTMGTECFPGLKRPGCDDHPPHLAPSLKKQFYSPSGSSWPVLGWPLPLPIIIIIIFTSELYKQMDNSCRPNSILTNVSAIHFSPNYPANLISLPEGFLSPQSDASKYLFLM